LPCRDTAGYDDDHTLETADRVTLAWAAGKQVVDASEWFVRSELSYHHGAFFARLDADKKYISIGASGLEVRDQYLQSTPTDGTSGNHELTSRS
jgi:hypothetical protein